MLTNVLVTLHTYAHNMQIVTTCVAATNVYVTTGTRKTESIRTWFASVSKLREIFIRSMITFVSVEVISVVLAWYA